MVLSSADIFFSKSVFLLLLFFLFFFGNISRVSSSLVQIMPVGSELGLNCLQMLSADDTSK